MRADRAADFTNGDRVPGAIQPRNRPAKLVVHQRHLQAERDGLRVDAVRAADHWHQLVLLRLRGDYVAQIEHILNENVGRLRHLHRERRIHDVR